LPLHCNQKQGDKIEQQNWPKNWNIAEFKESTNQSKQSCFSGRMPKGKYNLVNLLLQWIL